MRLRQRAFRFLLPAEYVLHIHTGFLHHFGLEVRVDIRRTSSGFDGHSLCKVASKPCIVFGPHHRFVATERQLNVFFHV